MEQVSFKISTGEKEYIVTPNIFDQVSSHGLLQKSEEYKIETDCEYLFTLGVEDYRWIINDKDVQSIDDNFIQNIGSAIDNYIG